MDNGAVPEAKNSIGNVDSLPPKTTFEWKDGAPNTAVGKPGEVSGTVIVGYPDGTSEEVPVKVNVRQSNEKGIPEVQLALPEFAGGVNAPDSPSRDIPEYTDPVGTSSTDGEGNEITPPTVEIPEYTDPVGTSSTDGEGNEITPPTIEIPEYTDPVGTSSTDGEGNLITPPIVEIPEFNGGTVAIDSPINKEDKYSEVQSPKVTKRLANTGETDTNVGLTGVGLAIAGSLLIFGKRRKKDEE